jgi:hypothetical protein
VLRELPHSSRLTIVLEMRLLLPAYAAGGLVPIPFFEQHKLLVQIIISNAQAVYPFSSFTHHAYDYLLSFAFPFDV